MEAHTFLNIKILNNLRNESSSAKTKNPFFESKALCDPLRPTPRDSPRRSALQAPLCARFYFGHNFSWSFLHYISLQNALPGQKVQAIEDPKVFALLSSLLFLSLLLLCWKGDRLRIGHPCLGAPVLYLSKISSQQYSVTFPFYHCKGISVEFPRSGPQM